MSYRFIVVAALLGCCLVLIMGSARAEPSVTGAKLYAGADTYGKTITTGSADAQRWFDQGLLLLYGFNHDEAIRSFKER